jgi:translation elongation factor EF-Tu-like GTPase
MSDADFESAQPQSGIWIIGQAGHGKSTLTAAIARVLSKSGSSRTLQCVEAGAAAACPEGTKIAILVVSAADGPMPQTRDHLKLARQAGVPRVLVFMNKIDVADKDLVDLVEMEMRDLMTFCGFAGDKAVVVRGSAAKALAGDASAIGEPSIQRLIDAVEGAASPSSGGFGGLLRRLFST